jgi:hypothetical protein
MAKRKPAPEPVPARAAPPPTVTASVPILSLKGSREWSEWFADLARESRTTKVGLIDRLTAEYAKEIGFRTPPER